MKKLTLVCCCMLLLNTVWAQKVNIDSLVRIAVYRSNSAKPQTVPDRDSLLKQLPFIKSPAARIKRIYDLILNYGDLNPKEALYYHRKILDQAQKYNDQIGESVILSDLGFTVSESGDDAEGVKIILRALELAKKTGNNQAIGIVYDNLGVCSIDINLKKLYFLNAVKFSLAGKDDLFTCYELGNLQSVYSYLHKPDSSNYYFLKEFELAVKKNLEQILPNAFNDLAQRQTSLAGKLKYLNIALNLPFTKLSPSTLTNILNNVSYTYLKAGRTDSALSYANKAYRASMRTFYTQRIGPAYLLSKLYTGRNADSALKYTNVYYQARDSAFSIEKIQRAQSLNFAAQQRRQEASEQKQAYQNSLRTYLLMAIIVFFLVLAIVFWRNNRKQKQTNLLLSEQKEEIETQRDNLGEALKELKATQTQLVQREKMASLGELTAGIAHEIQNPLNFVNNFSEVSAELIEELKEELGKGDVEEAVSIATDVEQNLEKIRHHGRRADAIVKGMLQHSRASSGQKEPTDLNALADEYLRLAYHGLRSKNKEFNAELITNFDPKLSKANVVAQDIGRVLLNLFNNAFYSVNEKAKTAGADYKPTVEVSTAQQNGSVIISVKDNGSGIPDTIKEKIMQPFFTTKPTGEGTGLGLSLSYDIVVKGHGGSIEVNTQEGEFTEFKVKMPVS
ncbi:MAG TPA: HAMP domain-containing sensor histidine kinase [Mucilaginibacter sp.]|nr:HAMP domain-containing sensor histidine kinase [Mucilaginibacter sp.]